MIVNDDTVHKALQYLAEDPHPVALAKKDVMDAERVRDETYAALYLEAEGSIDARKAAVLSEPQYSEALKAVATAEVEERRHRARIHAADMLIEVWRSENANARAAEKIR